MSRRSHEEKGLRPLRAVLPVAVWLVLLAASLCASAQVSASYSAKFDVQNQLQMKIMSPFDIAVVGDLNYVHPVAKLEDPQVQAALAIIRKADVGFANMEANIGEEWEPDNTPINGTTGPADIAPDVKAMGFEIVNRANNHTGENGPEGVIETNKLLHEQGIVTAGSGRDLEQARAAQYLETAKGRVALVGMMSISPAGYEGDPASYEFGNTGGTPGLNGLHLTMYQVLTQADFDVLKKIQGDIYSDRVDPSVRAHPVEPLAADESAALRMTRVGEWYTVGTDPGMLSYKMNPSDLREILRSIRNGKEYSGFEIATIHAHEDPSALDDDSTSEYPPDFLVDLAHQSIDNGADVFVAHGDHFLRGVEIYKGKPIFYGMASFTYQLNQQVAGVGLYLAQHQNPFTTTMTDAEVQWALWGSPDRPRMDCEDCMWSMVGECKYDKGQLQEVILHPIELGYGLPPGLRGIPRVPSPEEAQKILGHLQDISKRYGTTISIEGGLGVIHVGSQDAKR